MNLIIGSFQKILRVKFISLQLNIFPKFTVVHIDLHECVCMCECACVRESVCACKVHLRWTLVPLELSGVRSTNFPLTPSDRDPLFPRKLFGEREKGRGGTVGKFESKLLYEHLLILNRNILSIKHVNGKSQRRLT